MRGRAIVSLALALAVALAGTSCTPQGGTSGGGGTGGGGGGGSEEQSIPLAGTFGIIRDWSESTHSIPVTFAAEESGCVLCHDGRGFSMNTSDVASVNETAPFGPYVVATDCRACHTGNAVKILQSGKVSTPTTQNVTAGTGALCISCHRERGKPAVDQKPRAPHYSVQAAIYLGYGGFRQPGVTYGSTVKHTQVKNMCVGCHMTENAEGVPSHTFMPGDPKVICGDCHQGTTDFNRKASADYDGNGTTAGIQDEVKGLMSVLESATTEKMNADRLTSEEGQIVFFRGETTVTAPIPDDVYQAAYNWLMVRNDKSFGVHNPKYTVQLLQQSYRALTGSAVPNSKPFAGSGGATGSAGETGTGGGGTTPESTGGAGATGTP